MVASIIGALRYPKDDKGNPKTKKTATPTNVGQQLGANLDIEWLAGGQKPPMQLPTSITGMPMIETSQPPEDPSGAD